MKRFLFLVIVTLMSNLMLLSCSQPTETQPPPESNPTAEAAEPTAEAAEPTAEAAEPTTESSETAAVAELTEEQLKVFAQLPAEATPADYKLTEDLTNLGRMLYYENRLSINQKLSCNTCHLLDKYGVDGLQFSVGHDGKTGDRNAPTVYNAALHIAQFWDGRAKDVEEQAEGPVMNPVEMGMPDPTYVDKVLKSIPGYAPLFASAFPDEKEPINFKNAAKAIGAFERRLMTPSRFDKFLAGDKTQLNEQEQRGLATFVNTGCTACHFGSTIGGQTYQKLGLIEPYDTKDEGRKNVTGEESDKFFFKVPSLRNIAETAPYLHDGSIKTLDEMVRLMAKYELGKELTDDQVDDLIAFLKSLTGEVPTEYIAIPELPASGPDTPKATLANENNQ